ncbi:hypothetical protein EXIGLDRAFT_187503 [Exidia glandulosa HHB12029]|uniref:Uncharacterized protein n=1 Tax=Exidia glandulosa HHB12029 TaxID=1314781 RepID=A0A166A2H3_EXIGL|nr:hypothetical protein EXIGLDRAFT_187503 [Exidia glandulosa HHB12029]
MHMPMKHSEPNPSNASLSSAHMPREYITLTVGASNIASPGSPPAERTLTRPLSLKSCSSHSMLNWIDTSADDPIREIDDTSKLAIVCLRSRLSFAAVAVVNKLLKASEPPPRHFLPLAAAAQPNCVGISGCLPVLVVVQTKLSYRLHGARPGHITAAIVSGNSWVLASASEGRKPSLDDVHVRCTGSQLPEPATWRDAHLLRRVPRAQVREAPDACLARRAG